MDAFPALTFSMGSLSGGTGDPILYLSNPDGYDDKVQRDSLDALKRLNEETLARTADPQTAARIQSTNQRIACSLVLQNSWT